MPLLLMWEWLLNNVAMAWSAYYCVHGLIKRGTERNGTECKKLMNGTAESAQSTPTQPWFTELHPRKLVRARGEFFLLV